MGKITRLPPHAKTIHVEADLPASQRDEFERAIALDTALSNACLDYLNYDRLGIKEVHKHLENGDQDLHQWLNAYRIEPRR